LNAFLAKVYRREMFFPGWLGALINPFFFARRGLARAMRRHAAALRGRLLDVGCGSKPYATLFEVEAYVGLDIDSETTRRIGVADHFYDGNRFPLPDAAFDSVLCNQVLEHVFNPDEFLREVGRVLKPGGKLLLTVPFLWDEHEQPYDYARYSSFGLRALLQKNGFAVVSQEKLGADAAIVFQIANAYIFKVTRHWPGPLRILLTTPVFAASNVLGLIAAAVLPQNSDLFLDNIVLAEWRP